MDFSVTYKSIDAAMRAKKMFELRRESVLSVIDGKFRNARNADKEFAKIAVEDFDTFKTLPIIRMKNVSFKEWVGLAFKSLGFRIYKAFTKKTPEEKQLRQQNKLYRKELTPEELKKKTIEYNLPRYF